MHTLTFTDYGQTDMSSKWTCDTHCAQSDAQKDHVLYGLDDYGSIKTYDMRLLSEDVSFATCAWDYRQQACIAILGDLLFVIGGDDGSNQLDSVAMLDLTTPSWVTDNENINTARGSHGCVGADDSGTIWIAGGRIGSGSHLKSIERRVVLFGRRVIIMSPR